MIDSDFVVFDNIGKVKVFHCYSSLCGEEPDGSLAAHFHQLHQSGAEQLAPDFFVEQSGDHEDQVNDDREQCVENKGDHLQRNPAVAAAAVNKLIAQLRDVVQLAVINATAHFRTVQIAAFAAQQIRLEYPARADRHGGGNGDQVHEHENGMQHAARPQLPGAHLAFADLRSAIAGYHMMQIVVFNVLTARLYIRQRNQQTAYEDFNESRPFTGFEFKTAFFVESVQGLFDIHSIHRQSSQRNNIDSY
ncbi:hypothetical protein HCH_02948 [Hahella chejuensis KCTC 2396]|uniref:Uncharacterized protein n=1 Tax=Hahella chejuensis (strain KCTC 2396) TaxID=349521 RepID=Q2SI04_HAHCH|nr:hypothetical protein HCH_02948 [Hahella chejuensis KCTC 2396]